MKVKVSTMIQKMNEYDKKCSNELLFEYQVLTRELVQHQHEMYKKTLLIWSNKELPNDINRLILRFIGQTNVRNKPWRWILNKICFLVLLGQFLCITGAMLIVLEIMKAVLFSRFNPTATDMVLDSYIALNLPLTMWWSIL
eukprot:813895_1